MTLASRLPPGENVLHGFIAVAALKLDVTVSMAGYPSEVLHGFIAVAALKP